MTSSPVRNYGLAVASIAAVLVVAWVIHSGFGRIRTEAKQDAGSAVESIEGSTESGKNATTVVPHVRGQNKATGDSVNPSEERPPGSEIWFVDPDLGEDLRFRQVVLTPIDWDGGCSAHPFRRFTDLGTLAKEGAAIDASDYFASSALPLQFAQFWSDEKHFYQFGFKWEQNTPQTFSIDSYVSSDPFLTVNVSRFEVSDFPSRDGVLFSALRSFLKATLKEIAAGTNLRLGARIGLFRTFESTGGGAEPQYFFTQIRNAQVVAINGGGLNCQKSEEGERALCTCDASPVP